MSRFFLPGSLSTQYPLEPKIDKRCPVNLYYDTLPSGNANNTSYVCTPKEYRETGIWPRRRQRTGQFGKHITGTDLKTGQVTPNSYKYEYRDLPIDTFYASDLTRYDENGRFISSHFQAYPFTSREVREKNWYNPNCIPVPTMYRWSRYPVVDSSSCSNPHS